MTNKLERGVVPEIGDLSLLPVKFMGQPTYAPSGGSVDIAHFPVMTAITLSNFRAFARINIIGQTIVEFSLLLGDSAGFFRTIAMTNKGGYMFESPNITSLQTWNNFPRPVDRYAFRAVISNGNAVFIGVNGVAYPSFPTANCIMPGNSMIGTMPEETTPTLMDILGTTQPDPVFFTGNQSIYEMLNIVKNKVSGSAGHTHDGLNSARVFHNNIAGITPNDHHNRLHGLEDHVGQVIGGLSQISGVTISTPNLNSLASGNDSTLHYHNADRNRQNHTGTQTEESIVFSNTGHNHGGGNNGNRVSHANLTTITPDDHHSKNHGSDQHIGIIGTIEQINGLSQHVTTESLIELCSGGITALHSHAQDDQDDITLPIAESNITFSNAGHSHNGTNSSKINPANLIGCPEVTSEKLNSLCNGSTVTCHSHAELSPGTMKFFGIAPQFANMTIDNSYLTDCNGTWVSGCEASLSGQEGGFQTFTEWTTTLLTPQTSRIRIAVKLPNDFGWWTETNPVSFWFKALYSTETDVQLGLSIKDNIGLEIYNGTVAPGNSNGSWIQFVVPNIASGDFVRGEWILLTFEAQSKEVGNSIRIGRIDCRYVTQ